MGLISYSNQGATRNDPLSPELEAILEAAGLKIGLTGIDVFSGGQEAEGEGGDRTGTTRHDHGNAGDVKLLLDGRVLDSTNPQDLPIIQAFVAAARQGGATGIGAGVEYMGPNSLHVGFGTPSVWGAGGKSANTPDWLQEAYDNPQQFISSLLTASTGTPPWLTNSRQNTNANAAAGNASAGWTASASPISTSGVGSLTPTLIGTPAPDATVTGANATTDPVAATMNMLLNLMQQQEQPQQQPLPAPPPMVRARKPVSVEETSQTPDWYKSRMTRYARH